MGVYTYHCLCSELLLATTKQELESLPRRQGEGAFICEENAVHLTESVEYEDKAVILKLEDGFEKRFLMRCWRCAVCVGYALDLSLFEGTKEKSGRREGVVYVLEGAVLGTEEMEKGVKKD